MSNKNRQSSLIQAVIFDMDGVIINSMKFWEDAFRKVMNKEGSGFNERIWNKLKGGGVEEMAKNWYELAPWQGKKPEVLGEMIMDQVIDDIKKQGESINGAIDLIKYFKDKDIKLGLASSSYYKVIDAVLDKLDLKKYFPRVVSGQDTQFAKPHPQIYIKTAEKLKVNRIFCLVFEDSINGILAAKSAQMLCVALPEKNLQGSRKLGIADLEMDSLHDFDQKMWEKLNNLLKD